MSVGSNASAMSCRPVVGAEAEERYLESLNRCFGSWGGREMFDWCFKRESAGLRPDLMTLHAASDAVAGTANTYRRIRLSNGATLVAGIMTGSWTLPESRGLGAFTRLIGESRDLAASRGAGLLLAFVTHTNGSTSRLRDAGAGFFPTWYCRTPEEWRPDAVPGFRVANEARATDGGAPPVRFVYSGEEWRDQFTARPGGVMHVRSDDANAASWNALVERTPQFDRVWSLAASPSASASDRAEAAWADAIPALATRAAAANRRVFCFTSSPHRASQLRERGFEIIDGYLTAMIANEAKFCDAFGASSAQGLTSQALADPASPWFLGEWYVVNGDRM